MGTFECPFTNEVSNLSLRSMTATMLRACITLTDIHQREVGRVARLRDELVHRVFNAQRLVQLPRDGRQRTVRGLISSAAGHVDSDRESERLSGELCGLVRHA